MQKTWKKLVLLSFLDLKVNISGMAITSHMIFSDFWSRDLNQLFCQKFPFWEVFFRGVEWSINESNFQLSSGFIKNESLINQRTHNQYVPWIQVFLAAGQLFLKNSLLIQFLLYSSDFCVIAHCAFYYLILYTYYISVWLWTPSNSRNTISRKCTDIITIPLKKIKFPF